MMQTNRENAKIRSWKNKKYNIQIQLSEESK